MPPYPPLVAVEELCGVQLALVSVPEILRGLSSPFEKIRLIPLVASMALDLVFWPDVNLS